MAQVLQQNSNVLGTFCRFLEQEAYYVVLPQVS
jgi:hypothetical protein